MRFQAKVGAIKDLKAECLIVPVYAEQSLPAATKSADSACGGLISRVIDAGDFTGEAGKTLLLHAGHAPWARILLVGCGKKSGFDHVALRKASVAALRAVRATGAANAIISLGLENARGADPARRARIVAEAWHQVSYRYTSTKSEAPPADPALKLLTLPCRAAQANAIRKGLRVGDAIGRGVNLSRELGNLPANVCTPGYLADQARTIGKGHKNLSVEALNEAAMEKLGMGSLLSVTAGTHEPAKLIVMKYTGAAKSRRPIVLVGKGVTFDSGGISLKPGPGMDEMKFDMCGAATVLGVMQSVVLLKLPINVIGIVPAVENLPSGRATKPGDIVTSMSGQTIEILNTDAEGRLILCDALTYAQRFKPAALIDIATLTGACLVALGRHRSGLMSNSDALADALLKAGEAAGDGAWRLPLDDAYMRLLKSNFADMANIGGRDAGTITAGCFLSRFVEDSDWAHLDIAGTAWNTGGAKGSTGRPIPLLVEYLLNR